MVSTTSSEVLIDHAVQALVRRWDLSPEQARSTLSETAVALALDVGDLAALVAAAAEQSRALSAPPHHPRVATPLRVVPAPRRQLRVQSLDPAGWTARVTTRHDLADLPRPD